MMDRYNDWEKLYIHKCDQCKEEFDMYPVFKTNWVYKNRIKQKENYFCSYSCQMKYEREHKIVQYHYVATRRGKLQDM